MNVEEIREYCLGMVGASEAMPFNDTTIVFKVGDKVFALLEISKMFLNLKCDPDLAVELRITYSFITEGWHMNKRLWNSIWLNDFTECNQFLKEQIDNSYKLVFNGLSKKKQAQIAGIV